VVGADKGGAAGDEPVDVRGGVLDTSALLNRLPGVSHFELEVVDAVPVTPIMRRIRCTASNLSDLVYQPGQDLMLAVPADGVAFRRRYTIRRIDRTAGTLDLEMVVHGDGPGARWAAGAREGDRIEAIGPRGKIGLDPQAAWHLFAADESGIPGTFAMIEALASGATAIALLEVAGPEEEQVLIVNPGVTVRIEWLGRQGVEPGRSTVMIDATREVELPHGYGHSYLAGELKVVAGMRTTLSERDLAPEQISAKPYWRSGVANAAHGEPDRD
jgi:NADPH-dependent ferric siderophore reductase